MIKSPRTFDLEERTATFGEMVILFCKSLMQTPLSLPLITQLLRASTSVGANYMEANGASSKRDFLNKIFICKNEAQESKHWLRMLAVMFPEKKDDIRELWKEAQELTLIFQKITSNIRHGNVET
ncbi:MAG TPA: four helix bundle protein [Candidatus Saccharimonadales bacterium]|nr:four helix bundle protein [Candidatus Saccharimonadales bacterium]